MRRFGFFIVLVLIVMMAVTAITLAQTDAPQPIPNPNGVEIDQMIDGLAPDHYNLTRAPSGPVYLGPSANPPTDSCVDAPFLFVIPDAPGDGGAANVALMTEDEDDPVLSCMWGEPRRDNGFRTVWYKLIALSDGRITFDSFNSTYDTVIGVFTGECSSLTPVTCDDDSNGFSSQTTVEVSAGTVYYIEIADRSLDNVDTANMQLSVLLNPIESRWSQIISQPQSPAISRHATVVQGDHLYVIGGETFNVATDTSIISNKLYRFNAWYNTWEQLADIPGAGYANTTAARLGNYIYLPSGFSGAINDYDGEHWRYDIAADRWDFVRPLVDFEPLPDGRPFAWAAAAAHPAETHYYLTGGINNAPLTSETSVLNNVYAYTAETDLWSTESSMNSPRYGHTAAWISANNRGLCVIGGLSSPTDEGAPVLLSGGECYTPGGSWTATGNLNIARFAAGSAVGPDGRWYVFGGLNSLLRPVARTEVYDPATNQWEILPVPANLGNNSTAPARGWPRGEFVGNTLWVVGGSLYDNGEQALPLIEKMFVPSTNLYLPFTIGNYADWQINDDTLSTARPIGFGVPQTRNFDQQRDFFDFYTFEISEPRDVRIHLDVPDNNNFDLELYGQQKFMWAASNDVRQGHDEEISVNLTSNRYYILVKRVFPTAQPDKGANYTLSIN